MKKIAILMSVVMLIALTAGALLAAGEEAAKLETMSGQVVKVDAAAGNIVITSDGTECTLNAEAQLLDGVSAGDQVTVEKVGDMLKSIKKVEAPAAE